MVDQEDTRKRQLRFAANLRVRKFREIKRARHEAQQEVQDFSDNSSTENEQEEPGAEDAEYDVADNPQIANVNRDTASILNVSAYRNRSTSSSSAANVSMRNNTSTSNSSDDEEENSFASSPATDTSNVANASNEDSWYTSLSSNLDTSGVTETSSTVNSVWSEEGSGSQISDVIMITEIEQLREWAIESCIEQNHLDKLLKILRRRLLPDLPKSSKTFLKTSSVKYTVLEMEDAHGDVGEFVYFGLKANLEKIVDAETHTSDLIELIIDVDGMPVTQSGVKQMWVTACKIHYDPDIYQPFPVGIFYGRTKPVSPDIYLEQFIEELNELLLNGIDISGKNFNVRLKCFICDTPARAFLKCTLGHVARHTCERCTVQGTKKNAKSTVYPSANAPERTDESFRNMRQREHHHQPSPILRIQPEINIIFSFLLDFMHLCFLGVMKKLIEWWMTGDLNIRLGHRMKQELSKRMEDLKQHVP